jgi:hypothetical protein
MRKIQIICLAVIAAFAFSAVATSSAFALNIFLLNGEEIKKDTEVEVTGELLLEDMKVGAAMECSLTWDGEISENSKNGPIETLLTLAGESLEDSVKCTDQKDCEEALVKALELPWLLVADFSDPENKPTKTPTLRLFCKILGIKTEDTCSGSIGGKGFNEPGGLLVEMSETEPLTTLNCTVGGEKEGLVVGDVVISATAGGTLSGSA